MSAATTKPVALVTGASSGIGATAVTALAKAGYEVFGTSRRDGAATISGVTMIRCDVTDDTSVGETVATVLERTHRIDLLVNNAGMGLAGAAEETSIEQTRALFEVNFIGMVRMIQAVLPTMREARKGRILNVSSVFGFSPAPYMAVYAATKHAVEGYTESLDHEVRNWGIRAISIEPANTKTAFETNTVRADKTLGVYDDTRPRIEGMLTGMMRAGDEPGVIAAGIVKAAQADKPALRYALGRGRTLSLLRRFAPRNMYDQSLRKELGI